MPSNKTMESAPVVATTGLVAHPEVVAQWAQHSAALAAEIERTIADEAVCERLLTSNQAWLMACASFDAGAEFDAFVEQVVCADEEAAVEFMARLPLSMTHLAVPLLRVVAYAQLSNLVANNA